MSETFEDKPLAGKEGANLNIGEKLARGYTLTPDGKWVSGGQCGSSATAGGNINEMNMLASLETERLEALAKNEGATLRELIPNIIQAARFVGAYEIQSIMKPYEYGDGETSPSNEYVRSQIDTARGLLNKF